MQALASTSIGPEDELREWIRSECGGRPLLVGRANAGLACVLRTLCVPGAAVVFPATLCPSPVMTAVSLGFEAVFCDVRASDYTIDVECLSKLLDERSDIGAVLVPHLYGHQASIEEVSRLCQSRGIVVINDAAQALGGRDSSGRSLASFGDVALLSFGHTKIIDAGGGGALVVHNTSMLAALTSAVSQLPEAPTNLEEAGRAYRTLYYAICDASKVYEPATSLYQALTHCFAGIYSYRFQGQQRAQDIVHKLRNIETTIETRRRHARKLQQQLIHPSIAHPEVDFESIVPWRYTVCIDDRDRVADRLRAEGFDVSPWYPALNRWFACGEYRCPVAERLGARVLNFWVDGTTDIAALVPKMLGILSLS